MRHLIGLLAAAPLLFTAAAAAESGKTPHAANDAAFGQFMLNAAHWQDPRLWEQTRHAAVGWGNAAWIDSQSIWFASEHAEQTAVDHPRDLLVPAAGLVAKHGWEAALSTIGAGDLAEDLSNFITPSYVSDVSLTPLFSFEQVGVELQVDF